MHRLIALLLVAGCTPTTFAFSPTVKSVTRKPENCPIEAMTSLPSRDYQEIGTLEFYNGTEPKTLDDFKKAVAEQACRVGGDAVVAIADFKGLYTKGTVLAWTGPADASPSREPVPSKADKPTPPPAATQQIDNERPK